MRLRGAFLAAGLLAAALLARPAQGATDVAGVPAALVGQHGPTVDHLSGPLELVGHTPMPSLHPDDNGLPLGNNGAPALIGDCAYVGRWHEYAPVLQRGPQVVDVSSPANPVLVGDVPGALVPRAVSRELRAVDLPGFKMLAVLTFGSSLVATPATPPVNSLVLFTIPTDAQGNPDCRHPQKAGTLDLFPFRPHEFYLWLDPAHDVDGHPRMLAYITTPITPPTLLIADVSRPSAPRLIGVYDALGGTASPREENLVGGVEVGAGSYAHSISVSPDGREAYLSYWDGGFFTIDTSDFADDLPVKVARPKGAMTVPYLYAPGEFGNTHSAVPVRGTDTIVVADEIYVTTDGCPFGWLRTIDKGSLTEPPAQVGEFRLVENTEAGCDRTTGFVRSQNSLGQPIDGTFSIHNQTVTSRYVLASWYGGGLRVIDVANRSAPVEVAFFVPKPVPGDTATTPSTGAPTWGASDDPGDDWTIQMWSYPVLRGGYIYIVDTRNGLYVLRATPGSALATHLAAYPFLEGNSNFGDFVA